jgi:hypothetical protein
MSFQEIFFEMKNSKLINYLTGMCQSCQGYYRILIHPNFYPIFICLKYTRCKVVSTIH